MSNEIGFTPYIRSNYASLSSMPRDRDEEGAAGAVASTAFADLLQGSGDNAEGRLPVEMYAIPDWYAEYGFQVPNQLGASGNWFAEKYPQAAAASQSERDEYSSLVRKHYDNLLDANGIHDTVSHYNAMIKDSERSDQLRMDMAERVQNDPRLMELLARLGKSVV